jgi:hypothetical protein
MAMAMHFTRILGEDGERWLNIKISGTACVLNALIKHDLAGKPFLRDLEQSRLLIFWEMLGNAGITLRIRTIERFEDLEELARMELCFVACELARRTANDGRGT